MYVFFLSGTQMQSLRPLASNSAAAVAAAITWQNQNPEICHILSCAVYSTILGLTVMAPLHRCKAID